MTFVNMTSRAALVATGLALAACAPSTPPQRGVGFQDYSTYQAQERARAAREAQLSRTAGPVPPTLAVSNEVPAQTQAAPTAPPVDVVAVASEALDEPTATTNNPAISDEQSFEAVASRETIESDAERLERQRAQFQPVAPEALPERSGSSSPNIVEFALATNHAIGQPVYKRGRTSPSRTERNCAEYPSPDRAQIAFMEMGGPDRDRRGLDPDGDGFACGWDPRPFRAARGG
ncbi:hypothetical protein [Ovoidimarina sediminis]|uniref:hypothetical protein n=1 Tax=Ovoidimarina sediminis TaxID=3079856 RepID=UPI00291449D3|nr:hypothetical protein [Rhodophyticola sp. MJ-SS7]MDU8945386.1 hypothetical protein [Rhodophyticola sp. MJ-SS7]